MGETAEATRQELGGVRVTKYVEMPATLLRFRILTDSFQDQVTSGEKASFDKKVRTVRWLSTNGLKIVLQFYYTKSPMFTLPGGWLPYPVEWILCFPKAPVGTVSIQVWNNLCAAAIAVFAEILGGLAVQLVRKPAASSATKEAKKTQ